MDQSQVGLFVLPVYVSPQILPDPPSVLSWGPNSSLPQTGWSVKEGCPQVAFIEIFVQIVGQIKKYDSAV